MDFALLSFLAVLKSYQKSFLLFITFSSQYTATSMQSSVFLQLTLSQVFQTLEFTANSVYCHLCSEVSFSIRNLLSNL